MKTMRNVNVEMQVNGRPVRKILHGSGTYLPVAENDRFVVVISNRNPERVVAVVSVDGINVITGKPADHNGNGYVIDAWDSVTIDGFRTSDHAVKAFVVGKNRSYFDKTYAEKATGSDVNNGSIGVVIVPERKRPQVSVPKQPGPYRDPWPVKRRGIEPTLHNTEPDVAAMRCEVEEHTSRNLLNTITSFSGSVGAKMGEEKYSPCYRVDFERDDARKSVIVLYYDTTESLKAQGILMSSHAPNPFPAEPQEHYCPEL